MTGKNLFAMFLRFLQNLLPGPNSEAFCDHRHSKCVPLPPRCTDRKHSKPTSLQTPAALSSLNPTVCHSH